MKKATIKDVAREANVSIGTVSNAFHNPDVLSPITRERVIKAAESLNYFPNQNGQNLRAKETRAIGLFIASVAGAFYGVLADSMHRECVKHGYELHIYIVDQPVSIINYLAGRRVDGAVILYDAMTDALIKRIKKSGCPVVFLDKEIRHEAISSVIFDSYHEGEQAGKYLLGLGHRNLMHIYGLKDNYDSIQRFKGFRHALEEANVPFDEGNLLVGLFERDAAYHEMKRFIKEGRKLPDAVFASNDLSAIGCIEAFKDEGISVPYDVSVIGCDDIGVCELLDPPITTIHTSFERQGIIAISQLLKLLGGEEKGEIIKIEGRLIIRHSCSPRRE